MFRAICTPPPVSHRESSLLPGKAPGLAMVIATRTHPIHRSAACARLVGPKVPHSRSIVAGVA